MVPDGSIGFHMVPCGFHLGSSVGFHVGLHSFSNGSWRAPLGSTRFRSGLRSGSHVGSTWVPFSGCTIQFFPLGVNVGSRWIPLGSIWFHVGSTWAPFLGSMWFHSVFLQGLRANFYDFHWVPLGFGMGSGVDSMWVTPGFH